MRNLYLKDIMQNSVKISPFQPRTRLRSLKQLRHISTDNIEEESKFSQQKYFQILEKKMAQDNEKLQNQEVIEIIKKTNPNTKISKHTQKQQFEKKLNNLKQTNKLFQYFQQLYKKEVPSEKVQRQKVNFIERQFQEIKIKIKNKQELNKIKLHELKQNVKIKYLQLHKFHEQKKELDIKIKQEIKQKTIEEKMKKSKFQNKLNDSQNNLRKSTLISLKPPSLKEKLHILDDTINFMKAQITKIEGQIELINSKQISVEQEWINFLKIFINSGYYMSNGLDTVLLQMKNMNVNLTKNDLIGEILDENAKNYLLKFYQLFNQQPIQQNSYIFIDQTQNKNFESQRNRVKSNIEMKSLIKDCNLKEIYSNTREAVTNLLKNSSFRQAPLQKDKKISFFPKIEAKTQFNQRKSRSNTIDNDENLKKDKKQVTIQEKIQRLKSQQINRINHIYCENDKESQTKGKLIKRILFGFSVK